MSDLSELEMGLGLKKIAEKTVHCCNSMFYFRNLFGKELHMNHRHSAYQSNIFALILFSVAMGFLEAIVVVYVRELYYPEGFEFPLKALPPKIVAIELVREMTTLLMLGSVAWISGKSFVRRLLVFIFTFGIWDILYYVALKIFLGWPVSVFTWDILFLIPITWTSPVLAPVICSVVMILMALVLEWFRKKGKLLKFLWYELALLFTGAFVIFYTFIYDVGSIIISGNFLPDFLTLAEDPDFLNELTSYFPDDFQWGLFVLGLLIILAGNALIIRRAASNKS